MGAEAGDQRGRGFGQESGTARIWPGRRRLASRNWGLAWAMQGQAAPLPSWEAASSQRESPLWIVMLVGRARERSSVAGTTSKVPGWRRFGSEMAGLAARSSFQREPLPRWRRASFHRESPGWMRRALVLRALFTSGAADAARGARDGGAGIGLEGRSNFGAAVGGAVAWVVGACGAVTAREMAGFAGAE